MTADRPNLATAARRLVATLAAAAFPALLAAAPAMAATAPVATDCTPDASTACVAAIVMDEDNNFVPDVGVTISGAEFEALVTTTQEGPVSVEVPEVGTYTITLDEATLPEGLFPDPAEREVTAQRGSTARGAFRLGDQPVSSTPSAEPGASEGTGAETPAAGEEGSEEATGGGFSLANVWQKFGLGIRLGLLLALASVGISLIYGTTGLSTFAHGEQFTLGAVFTFMGVNMWGLPFWAAALFALALCTASGFVQDVVMWKPLRQRGTPLTQLMIITIGLSLTLQYTIQLMIGNGSERILSSNPTSMTIAGITLSSWSWASMGVAVIAILFIGWFLTRTRIGRATRAVSDNPALASATGINPDKIVRIVWTMSTGFAGLAGLMYGLSVGTFGWNTGMQMLLLMFAAVTLGGLGTAFGALAGSMVIGVVVEMSPLIPGMPNDLRYATALAILILVLLLRPQGLLGRRERIG
ncbi:branched-chain amino acid ABC transporter permease [Promicromonospora sp. NPDC060271]|uniref:branched-chain amino acid ABC transporter permease n=1 Tax=Promicromonospora sp. NPDC060271 TaxID=3347089 RepID=UPI003650DDC2